MLASWCWIALLAAHGATKCVGVGFLVSMEKQGPEPTCAWMQFPGCFGAWGGGSQSKEECGAQSLSVCREARLTHGAWRSGTTEPSGTGNQECWPTNYFFMKLVASLFVGSKRTLLLIGYGTLWMSLGFSQWLPSFWLWGSRIRVCQQSTILPSFLIPYLLLFQTWISLAF